MLSRNYPSVVRLRLRAVSDSMRESLFFVPAGIVVLGILLAELTTYLDRHVDDAHLPTLVTMSPEAAVALLGTVAGATITTAGIVFSIMVVSVQLASGQFSPRVVRSFFRDRLGQVVIGALIAVFVYCVIALQGVNRPGGSAAARDVPAISIDVALLLALTAVLAIVAYLDRGARGLYVGNIAVRVTNETLETLERLCRAEAGRADAGPADAGGSRAVLDPGSSDPAFRPAFDPGGDLAELGEPWYVTAHQDGWVQQLASDALLAAIPPGSVIRLETRPGAFLVEGQTLATVWSEPGAGSGEWPGPGTLDAMAERVRDAVVIGPRRTMQQDVDFGLRQLSDIALRALSPAVNDPTTAIEVTLRVTTILRRLLVSDLPPQARRDDRGSTLLRPWDLDHAEYVRHGFDQLRVYAAPHPAVAIAILRSLRVLVATVERAGLPERAEPLHQQTELLLAGVERAGLLPADVAAVRAAGGHLPSVR